MNIFEAIKRRTQKKYPIDAEGADEEIGVNMVEFDGGRVHGADEASAGRKYLCIFEQSGGCLRFLRKKLMVEDGEQYLIGIDSREEFDNALLHFAKRTLGT